MMRRPFILLLLLACLAACQTPAPRVPRVPEDLFDLADTVALGLQGLPGAELITVTRPEGERYVNNVVLTGFRGELFCMWQESARDEDAPDSFVALSRSRDGKHWSAPAPLAAPTDSTFASPGGWIQRGDSLCAVLNLICSPERAKGGTAWYIATKDGRDWSAPEPLRMADGSPMDGILEQDPLLLGNGRTVGAAHFRPGTQVAPICTDDPSGLRGWVRVPLAEGEGKPLEPSQYEAPDGRLVMSFRDQASSFRKLYSISEDKGSSWSAPALTNIPDSRSKQCSGTLPDGRTFWVGNPTGSKSRRILVLAVSRDGYLFDKAWVLATAADLPRQRFAGRYKTLGYSYPKAFVQPDGTLWISFSINKEDAAVIRIPPGTVPRS